MKKITLIFIALIAVGCSDAKDKYVSLYCEDIASGSFNVILNKETMTADFINADDSSDIVTGQFQEYEENYYLLTSGTTGNSVYLDRRTLRMKRTMDSQEIGIQCKKIVLPEAYLNKESDLKNQI